MIILCPYFGDVAKFAPLLERWVQCWRAVGLTMESAPAVLLSDNPKVEEVATRFAVGSAIVDVSLYRDVMRPGQPFDLKGALVCEYLKRWQYPTLVLDADAFLVRDPRPALEPFRHEPLAMPLDQGSQVYWRKGTLDAPFAHVRRLCAGVQFFGVPSPAFSRRYITSRYLAAYKSLVAMPVLPWSPPISALLEQFAWSVVAAELNAPILPAPLNWGRHHLGPNPAAVVHHYYDFHKWRDLPPVTPALASETAGQFPPQPA